MAHAKKTTAAKSKATVSQAAEKTPVTSAPATPEVTAEALAQGAAQAAPVAGTEAVANGETSPSESQVNSPSRGKAAPIGVKVVSLVEGFRRGGRGWSRAATTVLFDELSAEQLAAIKVEPQLSVTDVFELDGGEQ